MTQILGVLAKTKHGLRFISLSSVIAPPE